MKFDPTEIQEFDNYVIMIPIILIKSKYIIILNIIFDQWGIK